MDASIRSFIGLDMVFKEWYWCSRAVMYCDWYRVVTRICHVTRRVKQNCVVKAVFLKSVLVNERNVVKKDMEVLPKF